MPDKFDLDRMRKEIEKDELLGSHQQSASISQAEIMKLMKSKRATRKHHGAEKGDDAQDQDLP